MEGFKVKICEHCNQLFSDDKSFCPICGRALVKPVEYDIFGEPLDNKRTNIEPEIINSDGSVINNDNAYNIRDKRAEIFAFLSLGASLVPFFGLIFIINAFFINLNEYRRFKKNLGYLILTGICFIFSIIWIILLIKYGVLEEILNLNNEIEPEQI